LGKRGSKIDTKKKRNKKRRWGKKKIVNGLPAKTKQIDWQGRVEQKGQRFRPGEGKNRTTECCCQFGEFNEALGLPPIKDRQPLTKNDEVSSYSNEDGGKQTVVAHLCRLKSKLRSYPRSVKKNLLQHQVLEIKRIWGDLGGGN